MNQNTSNSPRRVSTLRRALLGTAVLSLSAVSIAACGSDDDPSMDSTTVTVFDTTAPVDNSAVDGTPTGPGDVPATGDTMAGTVAP